MDQQNTLEASELVDWAARLVSVQAGASLDDAHTLIRNTAEATDATIDEVAEEVVSGRAKFD